MIPIYRSLCFSYYWEKLIEHYVLVSFIAKTGFHPSEVYSQPFYHSTKIGSSTLLQTARLAINQAAPIIVFVNYSLIVLYSPGQTLWSRHLTGNYFFILSTTHTHNLTCTSTSIINLTFLKLYLQREMGQKFIYVISPSALQ